jgi:BirA family biotin operon repressor/biotin-[acetyl-CoA-carboxylase] ligase
MKPKLRDGQVASTATLSGALDVSWSHALESGVDETMLGFPILAYKTVTSTSDILKALALDGAPEGLTIVARTQTNGRGQHGRTWVSTPGLGAYFSVVIKPNMPGSDVKWLGVFSGLAIARALRGLGLEQVTLKWPNDVLVGGRKVAGVLVEPRLGNDRIHFAVVGVGVNVGHGEEDWPDELRGLATSCRMEGVTVDCNQVITRVLRELDAGYRRMKAEGTAFLADEWTQSGGSPPVV